MTPPALHFSFDNSYARELPGFYSLCPGARAPAPKIVALNAALAGELGLDPAALNTKEGALALSGSVAPEGAQPLAQAYAGHQFGGFSPQLGDGRALLLGELIDVHGRRRDLHLKGSGRTPYSRGGDGKAALGPVLREYLIGEAMHALGVPTTRALAAVTTGEQILREGAKPGAVLARVAASHLRVGTFQFFAARGEMHKVKQLADYTLHRHFPALCNREDRYLGLLSAVVDAQATLVAQWLHIGFVHGVMNTDNMTISGETIDYGPCAFIDSYDPKAVFSSIDRRGRYAFENQPIIARWNLTRFAETLLPLIGVESAGADNSEVENAGGESADVESTRRAIELAEEQLGAFEDRHNSVWLAGMRRKIGLGADEDEDSLLVAALFETMKDQDVDYTLFFRHLAAASSGQTAELEALSKDPASVAHWLARWNDRLRRDPLSPAQRCEAMNRVNPLYIPRNHKVEEALAAASDDGDFAPFTRLLEVLSDPFTQREGLDEYERPAPAEFGPYRTFCGT